MDAQGNIPKRENAPDAVYGSVMVTKLINNVMLDGKKSLAEKIVYEALETVREKTGKDPAELLDQAMKNIMPVLEVRPRRVGGATYQVPVEVRPERRVSLGLRWLVRFAQARGEKTMVEKLARNDGCRQRHWRGRSPTGGNPSHGRGQQGFRPLSLVASTGYPVRVTLYRREQSGQGICP